ncbi:phage integrase family site specific recombinase [Salmonella enterica subsp. enterica serovar Agona str. 241981]|nr:phage integrase family site specific recombinase [Salmonella enterica subsp. enterica serovar Agona str. 447967 1-1]ESO51429.1 phage integrase family site specific recombinase [Salmonella enterica subsp. enterica serovar Agona str. 241981]
MLTDTRLRHLKPKEKLYKVNDRDGLYVAVTPAGTISFRYNYSINGRQETVTFGRYGVGGITLAEARERLNEAKKNGCQWKVTRNLDVTRVRAIYKKADYREQRKAKMQD